MNATQIKAAQDLGKTLLVVDMNRTFDVVAMAAAGVDVGRLLVSQPGTSRQAREIAGAVIASGTVEIALFIGRVSDTMQGLIRTDAAGRAELVFA